MGGSEEWDNRMVENLKNFDLNSPEVKQQFGEFHDFCLMQHCFKKVCSFPFYYMWVTGYVSINNSSIHFYSAYRQLDYYACKSNELPSNLFRAYLLYTMTRVSSVLTLV